MRLGLAGVPEGGGLLSVAKLTLGQEAYYEQQVARGLDDYYAGRGESPGIWTGAGSTRLGLVGVVDDGELSTLLRGVNPANGGRLREPVRERTITVRMLDLEGGEWRNEARRLAPVSGYDLVFSCPKSVSLLHALTDDERVRCVISEAHEASWEAALGYLEREACVVRRGHGGAIRERGEGFVAAAFRHRTSRAQEPHLHTHVIVANLTRTHDGEWRALDGEAILKTYRLAGGYLYEAHLRQELTRRLGVEWTEPVKGMAELARVPETVIRAFSTRRRSLLEHMEALGTEGFAAARVAALATREAKSEIELARLRDQWSARAAELGLGARELEALTPRRPPRCDRLDRDRLGVDVFGPDGLVRRATTFTSPQLVQSVAGGVQTGMKVDQVEELVEMLARSDCVELVEAAAPGRPARFATRELLTVEQEALGLAVASRNVDSPRPNEKILFRALLSGSALSSEQRELIREASQSPDRVVCAVGVAGAGKTSALRIIHDAFRESGLQVLGAAPSGRAADELTCATGIHSATLHRLLLDAQRDGGLPPRCLLVIDEAGLAETRVLAPLLHLADRAEGKILLVGDPAQLPAVGPGGLFTALCGRLGAIELTANHRQSDPTEREALERLRAGDPEPYLAHAARHGRLTFEDDRLQAKQQLLADWWRYAQHDPAHAAMLAYHRSDVDELNHAAHALMLRSGRLGEQAVHLAGREFRVGDRVICRRNDSRIGIRNGTRGTIVDLEHATLLLRDHTGAEHGLPSAYAAEHLEHGYALTGHGAQGSTLDRAFVLLPDQGSLREWGYVACTRARYETWLYLASQAVERDSDTFARDRRTLPERAARALERTAAEPLAFDYIACRRGDVNARLRAQAQDQLVHQRVRVRDQLAAAERELTKLHWWSRGTRREKLQTELAYQQVALRGLDEKRAQLARTPPQPVRPALRPEPATRRTLHREPPRLEL
jgi:conjugative relaxase-like TrwC/TraI family protein